MGTHTPDLDDDTFSTDVDVAVSESDPGKAVARELEKAMNALHGHPKPVTAYEHVRNAYKQVTADE